MPVSACSVARFVLWSPCAKLNAPVSFKIKSNAPPAPGLIRDRNTLVEAIARTRELRQKRVDNQRLGGNEGSVGRGEVEPYFCEAHCAHRHDAPRRQVVGNLEALLPRRSRPSAARDGMPAAKSSRAPACSRRRLGIRRHSRSPFRAAGSASSSVTFSRLSENLVEIG